MIRIIVKYLVLVGLLAVVPTMALAERQAITLASNVPGNNLYVDGNGCLRDPSSGHPLISAGPLRTISGPTGCGRRW
jgi:hypothetical protein